MTTSQNVNSNLFSVLTRSHGFSACAEHRIVLRGKRFATLIGYELELHSGVGRNVYLGTDKQEFRSGISAAYMSAHRIHSPPFLDLPFMEIDATDENGYRTATVA
ncbi:hypothetical protein RSAG8_02884, partial [Rhizoctonia solani AG-8 WAC10335]